MPEWWLNICYVFVIISRLLTIPSKKYKRNWNDLVEGVKDAKSINRLFKIGPQLQEIARQKKEQLIKLTSKLQMIKTKN